MSVLCIACQKEVDGRRHSISCDVCERWQHRLCGTGTANRLHLKRPKVTSYSNYSYDTRYFEQQVDHFGFANPDTFNQRYLINTYHWNSGGPIFFYTGNEGDITWFCNNTGFMWDIASEFSAMLVFAEHRFYGESIPYGPGAYQNPKHLNYLTSEQALADFAVLINYLKQTIAGAANSSVVAFGGSYGGMLSAWMRIKYPNIVVGALAASAPIWQFTDITPCEAFNQVLTQGYNRSSPECVNNIRNSWTVIDSMVETDEGRLFISETFKLCSPLAHKDVGAFKDWLSNAWVDLGMVNYPYPANFLAPLPGWPVKAVCGQLLKPYEGKELIQHLYLAVNIYFNYTGTAKCLNISQDATSDLGDLGWDYQSCTEMVMPMCSNGIDDFFLPAKWNFTSYSENCLKRWKTVPRPYWIETEYWGKNLQNASNIIFSNGDLDPWSSGGVMESPNLSIIPLLIRDGAHHLDLRASNPLDTPEVKVARTQEKNIMKMWLGDV